MGQFLEFTLGDLMMIAGHLATRWLSTISRGSSGSLSFYFFGLLGFLVIWFDGLTSFFALDM